MIPLPGLQSSSGLQFAFEIKSRWLCGWQTPYLPLQPQLCQSRTFHPRGLLLISAHMPLKSPGLAFVPASVWNASSDVPSFILACFLLFSQISAKAMPSPRACLTAVSNECSTPISSGHILFVFFTGLFSIGNYIFTSLPVYYCSVPLNSKFYWGQGLYLFSCTNHRPDVWYKVGHQ